ncbi:MAG: hypothetical protein KGL39_15730 [Patescibacteria group bacterium]|nr:hypothetical protein [Patescibacteria group bacterium]
MPKLPWMPFFATDWLNDPLVSMCEPATRGILIDWICNMHLLNRCGQITGTRDQLARPGRCTTAQVGLALQDLIKTKAADVTERNGVVTVINRRMKREAKAREQGRKRVERHRHNGDVTPYARARASDLRLKSESESEVKPTKLKSDKGAEKALAKLTLDQREVADLLETLLGDQWVNDSGKWVNRIKADLGKAERVAAEVRNAAAEGRIKTTPAQYAEQIWKEFR